MNSSLAIGTTQMDDALKPHSQAENLDEALNQNDELAD